MSNSQSVKVMHVKSSRRNNDHNYCHSENESNETAGARIIRITRLAGNQLLVGNGSSVYSSTILPRRSKEKTTMKTLSSCISQSPLLSNITDQDQQQLNDSHSQDSDTIPIHKDTKLQKSSIHHDNASHESRLRSQKQALISSESKPVKLEKRSSWLLSRIHPFQVSSPLDNFTSVGTMTQGSGITNNSNKIRETQGTHISRFAKGTRDYKEKKDTRRRRYCQRLFGGCCSPCCCLITGLLLALLLVGLAILIALFINMKQNPIITTDGSTIAMNTSMTNTSSTITSTTSTSSTSTSMKSTSSTSTSTTSTSSTSTSAASTSTKTSTTSTTKTTLTTTTTTTTTTTKPYCTTRITFDDIFNQSATSSIVPNGYNNLNWTNAVYVNTSTMALSGYLYAVTSVPYVATNPGGAMMQITSVNGTSFSFDSMTITAAWRNNLAWTIYGYRSGVNTLAGSFALNVLNRTTVTCGGCTNYDTLYFGTSGGTPYPGLANNGTEFAFDDLCISFDY
ncbi:unnamed protein product [Adineta steineri]|uniref:Uncharacterized protein n=1 Tax=Adineta steineri TaxID=433720 RepID=A0A814XKR1_9BILA|nr:unnamed protein product [Adineta steineri]CAF4134273.1 unnamed protein product [Adineta steineri]